VASNKYVIGSGMQFLFCRVSMRIRCCKWISPAALSACQSAQGLLVQPLQRVFGRLQADGRCTQTLVSGSRWRKLLSPEYLLAVQA
jgi:hypothetical protein